MVKYNYTKASNIFLKFYDIWLDPWTTSSEERQKERRLFMRNITHNNNMSVYIDELARFIDEMGDNLNINDIESLKRLALSIVTFKNEE